jgi:hypothetical protein
VTINLSSNAPRRALRASVVAVGFALTTVATPALAAPPDTWDNSDNGPLLNDLMFLIGVPLAVIAVVTLLTYLPSLARGQSSHQEPSFRDNPEWFGGPRRGVDATSEADAPEESSSKGGASAQW